MSYTKTDYLSEGRKQYADKRADFYKKHADSGLIENVAKAISKRKSPDISELKRYLLAGNERTMAIISDFSKTFGALESPKPGEYHIAEKECVDARATSSTIFDTLERPMIHERTAASVVRKGSVFFVLDPVVGVGFVKTHYGCGGEGVAHDCHSNKMLGKLGDDVRAIVESVPPAIALIKDKVRRSQWNARIQSMSASALLDSRNLGNEVHPVMLTWENWPIVDILWCSDKKVAENAAVTQMRENLKLLWGIAKDQGRSPEKQYSHTIVYYDPFRLGRFNLPRTIFDLLPNEMFCVTEDFRSSKDPSHTLSSSAVGSLRYAGFLDGGHVAGVGGKEGNRHVMILDTDPEVISDIKLKLLRSSSDVASLTNNGQTITEAKYLPESGKVEFIG